MPSTGDDLRDFGEQTSAHLDVHRNAGTETLGDARRMGDDRSDDGWETLVLPAGDTAPEPPDAAPESRFGLVYVVPGDRAESFRDMHAEATFPDYEVYRATVHGRVFIVTELIDADATAAVYVAGNFELRYAQSLVVAAAANDRMHTHLQTLDGSPLGSFTHEEWRRFFPRPDRFL